MSPLIAFDLTILNDKPQKLGYLQSDLLSPFIVNDVLTPVGGSFGQISMPCEFWLTADGTKTMMAVRGSVSDLRAFADQLSVFIKEHKFASVAIITGNYNPLKRERDSNTQIPEVFCYGNHEMEKADYYNKMGIRKFGWWITNKKKPNQELGDMGQSGWAPRLYKTLCRLGDDKVPVGIFTIFCQGGIDFIGGFVLYQFIKKPIFDLNSGLKDIRDVRLADSHNLKGGEQVHEHIFHSGKVQFPAGWAQIVAYF